MADKIIDLLVAGNGDTIRRIRAQLQQQAPLKIEKPITILGDPAKRVEVGQFPVIPKDLIDPD